MKFRHVLLVCVNIGPQSQFGGGGELEYSSPSQDGYWRYLAREFCELPSKKVKFPESVSLTFISAYIVISVYKGKK